MTGATLMTVIKPTGTTWRPVIDDVEVLRPVLRYHGGKFRLAPWIISHFPAHRIYVEPFGGAAGVLIRKPRAYSEVYNDLDDDVANLFRVIRDPATRQQLVEMLVLTPYARSEFEAAWKPATEPIERARRLVVRAMMGFGSAGATKGTTGFRIDTKREYETAQHTWALYPHNLAAVGQRLSAVLIENRPAIEVIQAHDTPQTLHYIDPPYLHKTRCRVNGKGSARGYRYEMDEAEHLALLEMLRGGGEYREWSFSPAISPTSTTTTCPDGRSARRRPVFLPGVARRCARKSCG